MQRKGSREKKVIKTCQDLNVYQLSYKLAMKIFEMTKKFPKEEIYSLTDQIRRASRSISANIGEGWAKRRYENVFLRHLIDSYGSCEEIKIFLDFARDCKYINVGQYKELINQYNEVSAMLNSLIRNWRTY